LYRDFNPDSFDNVEDYKIEWKKKYNREKVKNEYENRKKDNGSISPPPQITEKEHFVEVNDNLNIHSSSSSSSNSSSSFSIFFPLTSTALSFFLILMN
jgi:hypothetical protein